MEPVDEGADARPDPSEASDEQLVTRVIEGHRPAFGVLMRRHNRRLFRVVRGIVGDDAETEDVCQETWLRAYAHLVELHDATSFSAWLGRIGRRCAFARLQHMHGIVSFDELDGHHRAGPPPDGEPDEPDGCLETRRLLRTIERAIDGLAPSYRAVVLLRDVEHMTTTEAAEVLGLSEQNVRVRLHRARATLREQLKGELGGDLGEVFRFDGERCSRIAAAVLGTLPPHSDRRYAARSA